MCFVTIKIELYGLTICSGQNKCKLYTMLKWYVNSDNSQINEILWNIYLLDTLLCLQIPFTGKLKKNWKNGTFLILIILSNVLKWWWCDCYELWWLFCVWKLALPERRIKVGKTTFGLYQYCRILQRSYLTILHNTWHCKRESFLWRSILFKEEWC